MVVINVVGWVHAWVCWVRTRLGKSIQFAMLNLGVQVLVTWIQVSTILLEWGQKLDWGANLL